MVVVLDEKVVVPHIPDEDLRQILRLMFPFVIAAGSWSNRNRFIFCRRVLVKLAGSIWPVSNGKLGVVGFNVLGSLLFSSRSFKGSAVPQGKRGFCTQAGAPWRPSTGAVQSYKLQLGRGEGEVVMILDSVTGGRVDEALPERRRSSRRRRVGKTLLRCSSNNFSRSR